MFTILTAAVLFLGFLLAVRCDQVTTILLTLENDMNESDWCQICPISANSNSLCSLIHLSEFWTKKIPIPSWRNGEELGKEVVLRIVCGGGSTSDEISEEYIGLLSWNSLRENDSRTLKIKSVISERRVISVEREKQSEEQALAQIHPKYQ